jgi:hypothetical protein
LGRRHPPGNACALLQDGDQQGLALVMSSYSRLDLLRVKRRIER